MQPVGDVFLQVGRHVRVALAQQGVDRVAVCRRQFTDACLSACQPPPQGGGVTFARRHYQWAAQWRRRAWGSPQRSCRSGGSGQAGWGARPSTGPCRGRWWRWCWCGPTGPCASAPTPAGPRCRPPGGQKREVQVTDETCTREFFLFIACWNIPNKRSDLHLTFVSIFFFQKPWMQFMKFDLLALVFCTKYLTSEIPWVTATNCHLTETLKHLNRTYERKGTDNCISVTILAPPSVFCPWRWCCQGRTCGRTCRALPSRAPQTSLPLPGGGQWECSKGERRAQSKLSLTQVTHVPPAATNDFFCLSFVTAANT